MEKEHPLCTELKKGGIDHIVYLPDTWTTPFHQALTSDPYFKIIRIAREEEGVAICTGLYLGGKRCALLIQNAGVCTSVNSLNLIANEYRVPLLLLVSNRGTIDDPRANQIAKGRVTQPILDALDIITDEVPTHREAGKIPQAFQFAQNWGRPVALLLGKEAFKAP